MPIMSPPSVPEDEPLLRLERHLAEDTIRIEQGREKLIDIGDALMTLRARMHNINLGEDPGVQVLTQETVSYTHLTLPTIHVECRSRWSPYH